MIAKTAKWGNSIGVRIPRDLAKRTGIGFDCTVEIYKADDGIIIKPVGKKEYSLKELVRGINQPFKEVRAFHDDLPFVHCLFLSQINKGRYRQSSYFSSRKWSFSSVGIVSTKGRVTLPDLTLNQGKVKDEEMGRGSPVV